MFNVRCDAIGVMCGLWSVVAAPTQVGKTRRHGRKMKRITSLFFDPKSVYYKKVSPDCDQ